MLNNLANTNVMPSRSKCRAMIDGDRDPEHLSEESINKAFQGAADQVAAAAAGKEALTKDQQLALYGLYKQATCGPCTTFRPSFFDVKARAKWSILCTEMAF